jgi:GAF domain-containing protein
LSTEEHAQIQVIEDAFQRHTRRLYEAKRDELERMHAKMKEACLELEATDPNLFKKAMIKMPAGVYFPIERRLPVDTPPVVGWNHDNALSTAVSKK